MKGAERARLWIVGGVLVAIGVLVIGWFGLVAPIVEQARSTQASIEAIREQNGVIVARNAELRAAQDDEENVRTDHERARTYIPAQPHIGEFGDALEALADQALVTLSRFSASDPRQDEDAPDLYATPVSFTVLGAGERVETFLGSLLADEQRALLVSGVDMLPADSEQPAGIAGDVVATVSGTVWTLTDGGPVSADGDAEAEAGADD